MTFFNHCLRWIGFLFIFVFFVIFCYVGHAEPTSKNIQETVIDSVVTIESTSLGIAEKYEPTAYDKLIDAYETKHNLPVNKDHFVFQTATGSGFFVSKNLIVTNAHVVKGAKNLIITLNSGKKIPATIFSFDEEFDFAIIMVENQTIVPLKISTETPHLGEHVFAIGSPFGLKNSVSDGIVSAFDRVTGNDGIPFLQTSVPLNPGNSGGPLFNQNGEVIGINTQIYSPTKTADGLSFSIPGVVIQNNINDLVNYGHIRKPSLGATITNVDDTLMDTFNLNDKNGIVVLDFAKGSPAEKYLKVGDKIIRFNNKDIYNVNQLIAEEHKIPVMIDVPITIIRDGNEMTFVIHTEEVLK